MLRRVLGQRGLAMTTPVPTRLGAGLAKNPNSVDAWRWYDPIEVRMVSPSDAAATQSAALSEPAEGQRWRVMIRASRRVLEPGAIMRVYGPATAAIELHLKVEEIVADWTEVREALFDRLWLIEPIAYTCADGGVWLALVGWALHGCVDDRSTCHVTPRRRSSVGMFVCVHPSIGMLCMEWRCGSIVGSS